MIDRSTIVVGIDGSDESLNALKFAQKEAAIRAGSSTLAIVSAFTDSLGLGRDDDAAPDALESLRSRMTELLGDDSNTVAVIPGEAAHVLAQAAASASLLVLGKRGSGGFRELLLGSTVTSCLQIAECPVAVVALGSDAAWNQPIVVGIDHSLATHRALAWAIDEAAARGVGVTALSAWRTPHLWEPMQGGASRYHLDAEHALSTALERVDAQGVPVTAQSVEGHFVEVLLNASKGMGGLVLGNESHGGGRIHGHSVAISAVTHASVPVIICP
jgi:nucleotide-binding universal stress UspA family protein